MTTRTIDIRIEGKGPVRKRELDHARAVLEEVVGIVGEPVLAAKASLALRPNLSIDHRCEAEASLDVDGEYVRARAFAPTPTEAIDAVNDKLRSQLRHRRDRRGRETIRGTPPTESWKHTKRTPKRPPFFDRPADERELVRHKTFAPRSSTDEEAFWDMTQLDYDFFLFRSETAGADSVMSYDDNHEAMVTSVDEAPTLDVGDAIDWMNTSGEPFVFFRDAESDRGSVIYRRYDGHYGMLTPR